MTPTPSTYQDVAAGGVTRRAGEPYLASHDPDRRTTVLADAPRTGGVLGVVVRDLRVGDGHGPDRHTAQDVAWLVLDGDIAFHVGDLHRTAGPLSLVHVPRGTAYRYRSLTDARLVLPTVPAGVERFVELTGRGTEVDAALVLAVAQEHRTEVLADFLPPSPDLSSPTTPSPQELP